MSLVATVADAVVRASELCAPDNGPPPALRRGAVPCQIVVDDEQFESGLEQELALAVASIREDPVDRQHPAWAWATALDAPTVAALRRAGAERAARFIEAHLAIPFLQRAFASTDEARWLIVECTRVDMLDGSIAFHCGAVPWRHAE